MRPETQVWSNALLLLAILALACTACATQATPTPSQATATAPSVVAEAKPTVTATPATIRVIRVMPVAHVTRNDEYYFDNCSGDYPVTRSLSEAAQVQKALTVTDQAVQLSSSATAPIPADVENKLGAEIEAAYQEELEAARATVIQTTLFANAHDRYNIVIVWEERVYSGTISFAMDGVAYSAGYTYTLEVPRGGQHQARHLHPLNAVDTSCQLAGPRMNSGVY